MYTRPKEKIMLIISAYILVSLLDNLSISFGSTSPQSEPTPIVLNDVRYAEEISSHILSMWKNFQADATYIKRKLSGRLPFVTLSYAQSLDGMIASIMEGTSLSSPTTSSNLKISCNESLVVTHAIRSIHDAVLVGGKTLWIDNPRLNNRLFKPNFSNMKQPVAVILDTNLTYIQKFRSFVFDNNMNNGDLPLLRASKLIICCSHRAASRLKNLPSNRTHVIDGENFILLGCKTKYDGSLDLVDVLLSLKSKYRINAVMVEGGATVLSSFLSTTCEEAAVHDIQIVDTFAITISPKLHGAVKGIGAFSKFDCSVVGLASQPSIDIFSPLSLLRKVGSDLIAVIPVVCKS